MNATFSRLRTLVCNIHKRKRLSLKKVTLNHTKSLHTNFHRFHAHAIIQKRQDIKRKLVRYTRASCLKLSVLNFKLLILNQNADFLPFTF